MKIILTPVRMDAPLTLHRKGDVLMFNGQHVDLAAGETCDWIARAVIEDNEWVVEVLLPHGPDAPEATRFPEPVTIKGDGPVDLPPWGAPDAEPGKAADA